MYIKCHTVHHEYILLLFASLKIELLKYADFILLHYILIVQYLTSVGKYDSFQGWHIEVLFLRLVSFAPVCLSVCQNTSCFPLLSNLTVLLKPRAGLGTTAVSWLLCWGLNSDTTVPVPFPTSILPLHRCQENLGRDLEILPWLQTLFRKNENGSPCPSFTHGFSASPFPTLHTALLNYALQFPAQATPSPPCYLV